MDIDRIVYSNKTSGFTEPCSRGEYFHIKYLNVYGKNYIPQRQLEKFIVDNKVSYKCYGYGVPDMIAKIHHCSVKSIRIFTIEFSILEINDEHIIVNVSEQVDLADNKKRLIQERVFFNPSTAKIEYIKKKNMVIGDYTCDAAIIVFDTQNTYNALFYYDDRVQDVSVNIGNFVFSMGYSLFVEMDGDWNKIIRDAQYHLMSAGQKLDHARKENTELREDNKLKEDAIKSLSQQNEELKNELQSYQEELTKTRKWAYDILHFDRDGSEGYDVSNEKDWEKFQSKVLELTEKMKKDSLKADKRNRLQNIKSACIKKYDRFDETDLAFLATGQYLLEVHKDDSMDFSPVLIAFSKCVEGVLADYLKKEFVVPEDERPMLGNSLIYVKKNSLLLGLTQSQSVTLLNQLDSFIKYRNRAAHKEGVSLEEVLRAKEIIFDSFDTFNKKYILDFIHSNY